MRCPSNNHDFHCNLLLQSEKGKKAEHKLSAFDTQRCQITPHSIRRWHQACIIWPIQEEGKKKTCKCHITFSHLNIQQHPWWEVSHLTNERTFQQNLIHTSGTDCSCTWSTGTRWKKAATLPGQVDEALVLCSVHPLQWAFKNNPLTLLSKSDL